MQVFLENVRSFCDQHDVPLEPLTLLVGENSTGKSTFMAMLAHLSRPEFESLRPSFNIPPFDLGTYDSIATFKGGRYGRADSFSVGFTEDISGEEPRKIVATYSNYKGQPQLDRYSASMQSGSISLEMGGGATGARATVKLVGSPVKEFPVDPRVVEAGMPVSFLLRLAFSEKGDLDAQKMVRLFRVLTQSATIPALALAPIRTKPRRTYDEFNDEFKPEGDHIPVMLARIWQEEKEPQKARLFEALNAFGKSSSLFKHIGVRRLGKSPTDPFQILVTTAGPPANLPDVGYGVSQALPLVVQSVMASERRRLLIQQPEVHLHPRGQAELGSFFARLVARGQKEFVIETHSDYLLDRVRVEVARGTLSPKDVLILFFEKDGLETQVHKIHLDGAGNVFDAPSSYRSFFLEEDANLFTRVHD
jgi:energy-coupling factor transporter ATP-binding protein EcfA2